MRNQRACRLTALLCLPLAPLMACSNEAPPSASFGDPLSGGALGPNVPSGTGGSAFPVGSGGQPANGTGGVALGSGGSSASGGSALGSGGDVAPEPEPAIAPAVYVSKVKSLLTGLPANETEVSRVAQDPTALKALIGEWQATPEYEERMLDFFTMAFQQGDLTSTMVNAVTPYQQGFLDDRVIQLMRESFGRTVLQLNREGAPFTDVLTTRRFMLTPALMVAMAWLDERQSGDGGGVDDRLRNKLGPNARYIMQADEQVPLTESADENSANYLRFYAPQVAATSGDCRSPQVVDWDNRITLYTHTMGETMMMFFMGQRVQRGFCVYEGQGVLDPSDFTTWRMMRIRKPAPGEEPTWVYEIPKFRNGDELVFHRPYVGFYTTPAFLYTWQTNPSNQARVTANQTLIAGLGQRFDGSFSVYPASADAISPEHTPEGTDCYSCHLTMDPMRQYFRSTYSLHWGLQTDDAQRNRPGVYAFDGETHIGSDIGDLGASLARSRLFARGWVHKLCTWATGAVCDPFGSNTDEPADPELRRIIEAFEASNFDWDALVQELFSSALVTYAEPTATSEAQGTTYPVTKKEHLCRLWDVRLGLDDACGLHALPTTSAGAVKTVATILPSDSYSRGQTMPNLANDPGLFLFSGMENACVAIARRVVDGTTGETRFQGADADNSLDAITRDFLGLLPPRSEAVTSLLTEHYQAALQQGANNTQALRSAFVLACTSPLIAGLGQ